jgi:hypothetical protein
MYYVYISNVRGAALAGVRLMKRAATPALQRLQMACQPYTEAALAPPCRVGRAVSFFLANMAKDHITKWIKRIVNGAGGFKVQEDREFILYADREAGVAEFVLRALANPRCEGSKEVVEAICKHRGDLLVHEEGDGGLYALERLYEYMSEGGHYEARQHIVAAAHLMGFHIEDWEANA